MGWGGAEGVGEVGRGCRRELFYPHTLTAKVLTLDTYRDYYSLLLVLHLFIGSISQ